MHLIHWNYVCVKLGHWNRNQSFLPVPKRWKCSTVHKSIKVMMLLSNVNAKEQIADAKKFAPTYCTCQWKGGCIATAVQCGINALISDFFISIRYAWQDNMVRLFISSSLLRVAGIVGFVLFHSAFLRLTFNPFLLGSDDHKRVYVCYLCRSDRLAVG